MLTRNAMVAVRVALVTLVLLGLAYPLLVTGAAQVLFPYQANGSLVVIEGEIVGSALIGQTFAGARYFHGRPSAAGSGYGGTASGASNLAPTSRALVARVRQDVALAMSQNPGLSSGDVPVDMVTASGSGLDPDITPANAYAQAARVARARGMQVAEVVAMIDSAVKGRQFGLLGEVRVNVLELNLALDVAR
jgi:K+-transporting ATPase ATPase C chain